MSHSISADGVTTSLDAPATLPAVGQSWESIERYFDAIDAMDPDPVLGGMSCYCMKPEDDTRSVLERAYLRFFHHNGVVRRMMPGVVKMEEDLLRRCGNLLGGGTPGVVANITSGGSESIFCAVHAIREWAGQVRGIDQAPEVIAPYSAHPAFSKACHYLGIRLVRVDVGADGRADADAMAAAITPRTAALVGSAPCWPYGVYDPIARLSDLAVEHGLWLHVDACVGGYLAPFVAKAGYDVPDWDFRLPGVMSMSADLHKYGYAAKPASTVAWRSEELLQYHHYSPDDWPGSAYVTQALAGSRPIGPVAAAWAVLNYLGEEGYVRLAGAAMRNKQLLLDGIAAIPGLRPRHSDLVLAYYESVDPAVSVQHIVGGLNELGWPSFGMQRPPLVQLAVEPFPEDGSVVRRYLRDVAAVVERIRDGDATQAGALSYAD